MFFLSILWNDLILGALNRFPFYLMPTEKQKLLAMVVSRMQNGAKIKMGPLSELNYATATQVMKQMHNDFIRKELKSFF